MRVVLGYLLLVNFIAALNRIITLKNVGEKEKNYFSVVYLKFLDSPYFSYSYLHFLF